MTGEQFCKLMETADLSVRAAAELLNVSPATVQRWRDEPDERSNIPHWAVTRIQHAADRRIRIARDGHVHMTGVEEPIGHVGKVRADDGSACWVADVRWRNESPQWGTMPGPVNSVNGEPGYRTKAAAVQAIARIWR